MGSFELVSKQCRQTLFIRNEVCAQREGGLAVWRTACTGSAPCCTHFDGNLTAPYSRRRPAADAEGTRLQDGARIQGDGVPPTAQQHLRTTSGPHNISGPRQDRVVRPEMRPQTLTRFAQHLCAVRIRMQMHLCAVRIRMQVAHVQNRVPCLSHLQHVPEGKLIPRPLAARTHAHAMPHATTRSCGDRELACTLAAHDGTRGLAETMASNNGKQRWQATSQDVARGATHSKRKTCRVLLCSASKSSCTAAGCERAPAPATLTGPAPVLRGSD